MLSEEALVFVAAIIACGVLVLGVLELLAPTRSRLPRRPATSNPSPQPRAAPSPRPAREPRPPLVTPTPPVTASSPFARAPAAVGPSSSEPSSGEPPIERLLRSQAASLEPPRRLQPPPPPPPPPPPSPPPPAPAPPAPLVPSLPPSAPVPRATSEPVASGLDAGAGEAGSVEIFEPPSVAAPRPAPPAAQPAPRPAMSASDRIYALWEGKQYAVVESEATAALARGGLSAGETARLWGLIGLARRAQADEDCPPPVQASFREMLAATFGGEVGQLTADAIRRMQEGKEEECLAALDRAETLLGTIPEEGIAPKRRQELERRLWWGYTKLGIRRVDGGMWEEALEPLLRALNFQGVGADRQEETRGPLIRALDAIVDARSPLIQRLTDEGDRDGALVTCDKLWAFLRTAMERGIGKDELGPALEKTQQLFERLGKRKP